ncbi:MAG TPA: 6-carboxytetrahydropterin synthase QueD [Myxococcaceae bacterium]|nr:6-carboxytetrahydropterin synthase QueD [Myxococcaceae bacterium]
MPMQLSVDFNFSAAHLLPFYNGPCSRLHGHNYRLQVVIQGTTNPKDGMIRDFEEIRVKVWEAVLAQCDHHNLNDFMENPTAENVVAWMWPRLKRQLDGLKELRLWETPEYCVAYQED